MTITETLTALLATLPKCHACEQPATRFFMSQHVPIPVQPIWLERGKTFTARPYNGPSLPWTLGHVHQPTDGTWSWDCCDSHEMPEAMRMGVWDHPIAGAVRAAREVVWAITTAPTGQQ